MARKSKGALFANLAGQGIENYFIHDRNDRQYIYLVCYEFGKLQLRIRIWIIFPTSQKVEVAIKGLEKGAREDKEGDFPTAFPVL